MIRSPCLICGHHLSGGDKNEPGCVACKKRIEYVAAIGTMSHSVPDVLCDYDRKEVESMPELNMKICANPDCVHGGKEIPVTKFANDKRAKDGHAAECRSCAISRMDKKSRKKPSKSLAKIDSEISNIIKKASPKTVTEIDDKTLSLILPQGLSSPNNLTVTIDFSRHREVFEGLVEVAEDSIRTVEQQALYMFIEAHRKGLDEIERRSA